MISSFFERAALVALVAPVMWILAFIPSLTIYNSGGIGIISTLLIIGFSNCTMGLVWNIIIYRETYGQGLKWSKFLNTDAGEGRFSMAICLLIFLAHTILYICTLLYINDWNLFTKIYNLFRRMKTSNVEAKTNEVVETQIVTDDTDKKRRNLMILVDNKFKKLLVTVNDVEKEYDNITVLKKTNLNLYQNEIIVLMGHNGAGKTTLLSIIAGIIKPTYGTVLLEKVDVHKERQSISAKISFSHQNNSLFEKLSFREHLYLFARLKGLRKLEADEKVDYYIKHLGIERHSNTLADKLSSGVKHILSVCCALIGKQKVVLIDDFGNGVDAYTRLLVWDLMIYEKTEKTMLISTNSFETLKVLADRVLILSRGQILCNGTIAFLKTVYDKGYRLVR